MVEYLTERPRAINGDDMRLGKTACAVTAATQLGLTDVLVVCPAIGRTHWERQIPLWGGNPAHWRVVSYETFRRAPDHARQAPQCVIVDECHRIKNREAQQTQALYGKKCHGTWLRDARAVWLLSGTLIPNNASELWTHFRALFGETMSYHQWVGRYCISVPTPFGDRIVGNREENVPELRAKLHAVMLRRRQAQVWEQVPALNWNVQEIEGPIADVIEAERGRPFDPDVESFHDVAVYATLRRLTGLAKVDGAARHIADLIDGGARKIVAFAWHHEVMDALAERLLAAHGLTSFQLSGRVTETKREGRIRAFQESPGPHILIGQIQACSEVICLDQADHEVFVETSWTPKDDAQAAQRGHAFSRQRALPVDILALAGTTDEAVARAKVRKRLMQTQLMEG
jgi:hypothetical protein